MKQVIFRQIQKIYNKNIVALEDVSFAIDFGEFLFITGHSGAGKSTLLRLLIREELPTAGDIIFENINVPDIPDFLLPDFRKQIGVVFQDLKLIKNKTAKENIEFALEILGTQPKKVRETTEYLLDLIHLQDRANLLPQQLSGGEKQKVAIARAIAASPGLLVADEPTGNLDPDSSAEILELLKEINQTGTTIAVITHNYELINTNDRVIKINKGRIVEDKNKKPTQQHTNKTPITELELSDHIVRSFSLNDFIFIEDILELTDKDLVQIGLRKKEITKFKEKLKNYLLDQKQ